jgi:hypothetical protein
LHNILTNLHGTRPIQKSLGGHKISRLSWKPALDPILRQMNPLHTSQPMSVRYTLILRAPPMEPGWLSRCMNQATGSTMKESDWISRGGGSFLTSSRTLSTKRGGEVSQGEMRTRCEAHHSSSSSIEVKYACSCNSAHLLVVMMYCLLKHRGNLLICAYISKIGCTFQTY